MDPTIEEITRIIDAKKRAEKDIAYFESVKLDAQQIEGTRYRIRLTESSNA